MPDLTASDHQLARFVLERGIAAIYLVAFVVALDQFPALLGEHGLMPARRFLAARRFLEAPSLFHLGYSDRRLIAACARHSLVSRDSGRRDGSVRRAVSHRSGRQQAGPGRLASGERLRCR